VVLVILVSVDGYMHVHLQRVAGFGVAVAATGDARRAMFGLTLSGVEQWHRGGKSWTV